MARRSPPKYDIPDDKIEPKINPPVCGSQDYTCDTGAIGEIIPPSRWTCTNDGITIDCGGNSAPPVCGSSVNTCDQGTLIENFNDEYSWQCKSGSETIDCSISPPSPTPPPNFENCDCSLLGSGKMGNWITVSNAEGGAPYCLNQDSGLSAPCPEGGLEVPPPPSGPTSISKCGYTVDDPSYDYDNLSLHCNEELNSNNVMTETQFMTFINSHLKNFDPDAFRSVRGNPIIYIVNRYDYDYDYDYEWFNYAYQYSINAGQDGYFDLMVDASGDWINYTLSFTETLNGQWGTIVSNYVNYFCAYNVNTNKCDYFEAYVDIDPAFQ